MSYLGLFLVITCISQALWVMVENAEINEIYNFVYSTDWPLVNILVKAVRCLNLFLVQHQNGRIRTWLV